MMNINEIIDRHIGAIYPKDFKCVSFVSMIYAECGLSIDFSIQPIISNLYELSLEENIGKIIFLMRKDSKAYLYSHVGIIYDIESIVSYSRHLGNNYKVRISQFAEVLNIYSLIPNPYVVSKNKVRFPTLK